MAVDDVGQREEFTCPWCNALIVEWVPVETKCHGCKRGIVAEWINGKLEVFVTPSG